MNRQKRREADRHGSTCRSEQGNDTPGSRDKSHADEQTFAESRRLIVVRVKSVNRHEKRINTRSYGRVGHDQGQRRGNDKGAEVDHAGAVADQSQHAVGQSSGKPGL